MVQIGQKSDRSDSNILKVFLNRVRALMISELKWIARIFPRPTQMHSGDESESTTF